MNPPCPSRDSTIAVQCTPAEVCLKDASEEPVEMSCSEMVPGPEVEVEGVGVVVHIIHS